MNRKSVGSLLFVVLIVLLCLVAACTTDQFTQKESKTKGPLTAEERARQAEEARVLESMWYEGSAYHRGRDDSGAVDVGKWMRNRKEMKAQQEETEKRLAKLEKKAEKQQPKVWDLNQRPPWLRLLQRRTREPNPSSPSASKWQ
jgi:ABC-type Fe3+-citrate transport system substrate-binding protein